MIPQKIHKILITDDDTIPIRTGILDAIETWRVQNPSYEVILYRHDDCRNYIREHYSETNYLQLFDKIKAHCYKTDLMRHLILYNEGGWYSDARQVCLDSLDNILDYVGPTKKYITSYDLLFTGWINTSFIGSVAKHQASKKMIEHSMGNVERSYYGENAVDICGPLAYTKAIVEFKNHDDVYLGQKIRHQVIDGVGQALECIHFGPIILLQCKYNNAAGGNCDDLPGGNNYNEFWISKTLYNP